MRYIFLYTLVILVTVSSASAQQLVRHVTTPENIAGHITTIDHPAANGKENAILIVTQHYGVYNANEIGVWYADGRWKIFNQNRTPMPQRLMFNILVTEPNQPNSFVHTTDASNTRGHITTLTHPSADGNPNAILFVTQHYGQYNSNPVGVWYSNGKWKVYNETRQAIPVNTKFNVVVLNEGATGHQLNSLNGSVFRHTVRAETLLKFPGKHVSYIDNASTNSKNGIALFSTQQYHNTYNTSITGVWFDSPNWTVFNQDRKQMPENVVFNILALEAPTLILRPIFTRNIPVVREKTDNEKINWRAATRANESKVFILPYKETKEEAPAAGGSSTELQGPNLNLGKDINTLFTDPGLNLFLSKVNLFRELYEDKNPRSGYFYYLPRNYNLKWSREGGEYSFYIYYLSAGAEGRGDVIITAELTPNISRDDIALAETLLSKKLNKEIKLRPLPLKDTPKVSFGSALTNFDVKDESIQTNVPSDFLEPIIVSWKMQRRVDDFIGAMMNNIGISGNVTFLPHGDVEKVVSVPVKLKINDAQTFGKMEYREAASLLNGFHNPMDYPVQLKGLVLMRAKTDKDYTVESIPLNNYEVEPQKFFSAFSQSEKDAILNGNVVSKMWVEYAVKPCSACNASVQSKIMGGTSGSRVKKIEVQVLTPLAFSNANSLKLMIKSKQGDPNGNTDVLLPILTITQDNQTISGGELFVPEGGEPEYQYQLVLIQRDGTTLSSEWVNSKDLFIVLGENTIRTSFAMADADESTAENTQPLETDEN